MLDVCERCVYSRVIRLKCAPGYLGMDKNKFRTEVRPYVTVVSYGEQSVAFDRLELDAWWEDHKSRNGRPGQDQNGDAICLIKERPALPKEMARGTSIKQSTEGGFAEVAKQARLQMQKTT